MRTNVLLVAVCIEIVLAVPSRQWGIRVDGLKRGPSARVKESQAVSRHQPNHQQSDTHGKDEIFDPLASDEKLKVVDYPTCMQSCGRRVCPFLLD